MAPMELTKEVWTFVIALAAVVNGLGIVRLLGGFSDYLKNRESLDVAHYWVYALTSIFQFLVHLLLWWSIIGLKAAANIDFLTYLYLLIGPTLLFLGTSLLIPDAGKESINLREHYFGIQKAFYLIGILFWLWAVFLWPAFGYSFAPTVPLICLFLLISLVLRFTRDQRVHAVLVIGNLVVYAMFVALYAMQLGAVARQMTG
ncbi:MAG: hypothetical protein DRR11_04160 [Gammaproteobacteria bacterium]|nr:MAG: hypothetical protein DRR11_04160 [Gammaproteobacteria bacterium]RLA35808.1 MAG: hypothetical protein DRR15_06505 [Gammaproteobacteria bacterium]